MSDFEQRVTRALAAGADAAPAADGLAEAARVRMRRRRRLAVAGAAAAVLAVVVPVSVITGGGPTTGPAPSDEPSQAVDDIEVSCGGGEGWPVSVMDGGLGDVVPEAEVRAAFADLLDRAPMDAPPAIIEDGPERASYIVLTADDDHVTLGVGPWSTDGPGTGAMTLGLERTAEGWEARSWGDCRSLEVALPPGRSRVEVSAPRGGVASDTTEPVVMVNERQCASGRDPQPFLGEPTIAEDAERVVVTLSSEASTGAGTCQDNPSVPLTLHLDEPLGDRELLDGGSWPPTRIKTADVASWQTVTRDGVTARVPADWTAYDCSGLPQYNPSPGCDATGAGLKLLGSDTFDPTMGEGELVRSRFEGEVLWGGYAYAGEWAVLVATPERSMTRQILDTVRETDGG